MATQKRYKGALVDIFNMGVLLFIMVVGVPPFENSNKNDEYFKALTGGTDVKKFWRAMERHHKFKFSFEFKSLVTVMCQ